MKNYKFTINGNKHSVDIVDIEDQVATVEVNGIPYQVELEVEVKKPVSAPKPVVKPVAPVAPSTLQVAPKTAAAPQATAAPSGGTIIKSPLPGVVLNIYVEVGEIVKAGQRIIMLEAMKMENNIDTDKDGMVKEIRVHKNDAVMEGDVLVVIG
jgi:biotin carboxyl carrier protein